MRSVAAKVSAGIILCRRRDGELQMLLGHMGGPFWARRDDHAWTIIKGEREPGEEPFAAARREFEEELGQESPVDGYHDLGEIKQSGKTVTAWAVTADLDPSTIVPGTFELEWPRGSGRMQSFPEIDRVAWFPPADAERKLVKGQVAFIPRLVALFG